MRAYLFIASLILIPLSSMGQTPEVWNSVSREMEELSLTSEVRLLDSKGNEGPARITKKRIAPHGLLVSYLFTDKGTKTKQGIKYFPMRNSVCNISRLGKVAVTGWHCRLKLGDKVRVGYVAVYYNKEGKKTARSIRDTDIQRLGEGDLATVQLPKEALENWDSYEETSLGSAEYHEKPFAITIAGYDNFEKVNPSYKDEILSKGDLPIIYIFRVKEYQANRLVPFLVENYRDGGYKAYRFPLVEQYDANVYFHKGPELYKGSSGSLIFRNYGESDLRPMATFGYSIEQNLFKSADPKLSITMWDREIPFLPESNGMLFGWGTFFTEKDWQTIAP